MRPEFKKLPDHKEGQEREVGERFAQFAAEEVGCDLIAETLPENDHDCQLKARDGAVVASVQMVEVVQRELLVPISEKDWVESAGGNFVLPELGQYARVAADVDQAIVRKIALKLAKHYAKPSTCELWLLIWSVSSYSIGSSYHAGHWVESAAVGAAKGYAAAHDLGPFSRIYFMSLGLRPERIWPPELLGRPQGE